MSLVTSIRLNLGLKSWQHHALFWLGGLSGLYFGQIAMHSVLSPDESFPEVDEAQVMAKFLQATPVALEDQEAASTDQTR